MIYKHALGDAPKRVAYDRSQGIALTRIYSKRTMPELVTRQQVAEQTEYMAFGPKQILNKSKFFSKS
jgi:hypothetical protein